MTSKHFFRHFRSVVTLFPRVGCDRSLEFKAEQSLDRLNDIPVLLDERLIDCERTGDPAEKVQIRRV